MAQPSSPFPKLTRKERTALNQVLWAKRILREAPAERLQLAQRIEQLTQQHDLPERGGRTAQSDSVSKSLGLGPDQQGWADGLDLPPRRDGKSEPEDQD